MIPKDEKVKEFVILVCKEFTHIPTDGSVFPYIGDLSEDDTIQTILHKIYKYGNNNGIEHGKNLKINEIKKVLNIEDDK